MFAVFGTLVEFETNLNRERTLPNGALYAGAARNDGNDVERVLRSVRRSGPLGKDGG